MDILLLHPDIFATGQPNADVIFFYRRLVAALPEHTFHYYLVDEHPAALRPANAQGIPFTAGQADSPPDPANLFSGAALVAAIRSGEFMERIRLFTDKLARHVAGRRFDSVEYSDYMPVGDTLREALAAHSVRYGKLVMFLHERRSTTLRSAWEPLEAENLAALENAQFGDADAAYSLSERHARAWAAVYARRIVLLDPLRFISKGSPTPAEAAPLPLPVYVGSLEKRQGPDLFLTLMRWLSPQWRADPPLLIAVDGSDADEEAVRTWAGRLELAPRIVREADPDKAAASVPCDAMCMFPARSGALNLMALEALFRGNPVAVSDQDGLCDYLDKHWPHVPFIRIAFAAFHQSAEAVDDVLRNFREYRAVLRSRLALPPALPPRQDVGILYREMMRPPAMRSVTPMPGLSGPEPCPPRNGPDAAPASPLAPLRPPRKEARAADLEAHFAAFGRNYADWLDMGENSAWACHDKIAALHELYKDMNLLTLSRIAGGEQDAPWPDHPDYFPGSLFACTFWNHLARLQRIVGDEASAATFELRTMRVWGWDRFGTLRRTLRGLERHGYQQEAAGAALMFTPDTEAAREEKIHAFLKERLTAFKETRETPLDFVDDARGSAQPKVAVIVSLYNAAPYLEQFLACLSRQTLARQGLVEVILHDSSPKSDAWPIVKRFMQRGPLPIYYGYTSRRETIYIAWNRGIKAARAPYVTFPGVDEMFYPEGLEVLSRKLDAEPDTDWAVANCLQVEVSDKGVPENYIATFMYDAESRGDMFPQCLRRIRWLSCLYRKSLHDRFGYYDPDSRAASSDDFALRVLPYITVSYISKLLGVYWDYPSPRMTTGLPYLSELEQYRYIFLHRTAGGVRYLRENTSDEEVLRHLERCLSFRRTVCCHLSTDFMYASMLCGLLRQRRSMLPYPAEAVVEALRAAQESTILPVEWNRGRDIGQNALELYQKTQAALKACNKSIVMTLRDNPPCAFALYNDYMFQRYFCFIVGDYSRETTVFRH